MFPIKPIKPTFHRISRSTCRRYAAAMLCISLASGVCAATIDTSTYYANLRRKLSVDKKVSISYLGGSITQGQGASNKAVTAWKPLTTTWFKTKYPQATVTELDASWGSTGSDLGAFRCTRDVCSKNPDLVFIEFAVNDWAKTAADIQPYMDGIIRNIWRTLPNCVISIIYTVHNGTIGAYDKGTYPPAVLAQQAVADYYHVGSINVGKKLWEATKSGKGTISTLTVDGTHPTDEGYKIYADEIAGVLERYLLTPPVPAAYAPVTLPKPFVSNTVDNGVIIMADQLSFPGWKNSATGNARFPNVISCNTPGTKLTYPFKGTAVGMDWMPGTDGGEMQWSVDNSTPVQKSGYASSSRDSYPCLINTLPHGSHTFVIDVLSTKNVASTGNYIRMGALFINEDVPGVAADPTIRGNASPMFSFHPVAQGSRGLPCAIILTTPVRDFFNITRIGVSGRTYDCLFKGELGPGYHRIDFQNAKVPQGVYLFSIKSIGHGQSTKMTAALE
jgi:lysophospholipase L1-like esterase